MSLQLKLQTPEGTFIEDVQGSYLHFAIDCICGGKSGSYYKNARKSTQETFDTHWPRNPASRLAHTFYMNDRIFEVHLDNWHNPDSISDDAPLIITCKDCQREFSFTLNKYDTLRRRILDEGTRTEN